MLKPKFNQSIVVAKGTDVSYSNHSTQVNLLSDIFKIIQRKIPEDTIYREFPQIKDKWGNLKDNPNEEYGYENQAHVTVLYGIQNESDYFEIRRILAKAEPPELEVGKISSFRRDDSPFDVLKLDVISPSLSKIHNLLKNKFENNYKFPDYQPHITLAYIKKNTNTEIEKSCAWTGTRYQVNAVQFCHKDGYYLPMQVGEK